MSIAAAIGVGTPPSALAQAGEGTPAVTQATRERHYNIPGGPLDAELNRFALAAGIDLSVSSELTRGKTSPGLKGRYSVNAALQRLLAGSGLAYRFTGADTVTLVEAAAQEGDGPIQLGTITVEGASTSRLGTADYERDEGFKAEFQQSATKTPLSIRETPQSVTVITQDSIQARQATNLTSALEMAASVAPTVTPGAFAGRGYRAGDMFVLRGQFLNGNRDIRNDGFAVASADNPSDLALYERVEVIKGPSSVLYGQGSVAGFINRVRKKPQAERTLSAVGQIGSYDTYRSELDVTGSLIEGKGIDGRLIGVFEDAGSFVDGVESQRKLIAPSLSFELGEDTRLLLQGLYQDDDYIVNTGIPLRPDGMELKAPRIPRSRFFGVPGPVSEGHLIDLGLQLDHQLSDGWLLALRLNHNDIRRRNVQDNYGYGLYPDGSSTVYASNANQDADSWSGEIRLDGRFDLLGRSHQLTAGIERRDFEYRFFNGYQAFGSASIYDDNFGSIETIPGADVPISRDGNLDSVDQGAYAQLVLSLTERTKLVAGARYDQSRQRNTNNLTNTSTRLNKNAWTYRIGATQELTQNLSAFALYAQSFVPVTAQSADGSVLEPETGEGFELGLKTEWFDQRLGATLSVFRQERDDVPIPDPDNRNFSISAGLQRTDGVELELAGSPIDGLTLGAALSWLDGEYANPDDPNFGDQPFGTVRRQSNLYAHYELQSGPLRGFGAGATLVSVGDRFLNGDMFVKGYERVDLNFSYNALPGWELGLQVRNLLDETYLESVNRTFFLNYFGAPRAVLFRAEYTFDL